MASVKLSNLMLAFLKGDSAIIVNVYFIGRAILMNNNDFRMFAQRILYLEVSLFYQIIGYAWIYSSPLHVRKHQLNLLEQHTVFYLYYRSLRKPN